MRHQRLLPRPRRPVRGSTWLPDGSRPACHAHTGPIYVSFVSKATLWDRGLSHYTNHDRPNHRPLLCPRFLSHMKVRPEDVRPPCFLSSKPRLQPPSQGRTLHTHALPAPKRQTLDGSFHRSEDRRAKLTHSHGFITGRRSTVAVPRPPIPAAPPSSAINPTLKQNPPRPDSGGQQSETNSSSPCASNRHPAAGETVQERESQPDAESIADSDRQLRLSLAGEERSPSLVSVVSHGSLSDFSRPASSLFSRSTSFSSGGISVLSAKEERDFDPEGRACLTPLQPRPVMESTLASHPSAVKNPRRSASKATPTPELSEPHTGQTKLLSPRPTSGFRPQSDKPLSRPESPKTTENLQDARVDPGLDPSQDSNHGPVTLTFPSATWSSCPSPQRTTPRSGSGPKLTSSASATRLESHRWPVLPPISPVSGRCGTAASRYSELSCSESCVFDELEAIAPRSTSCPSLDEASDSSSSPSPHTALSPGLAALTVGCDSGNLGPLSRVQLLLLDRLEPESPMSPFDQEEEPSPVQDWSDLRMQVDPGLTSAGVLRPLTAGGISERCDSAGKVQRNKSNHSEGGSGSPSSWIIDPSPSCDMFRSAHSPHEYNQGSCTNKGELTAKESNYPRWREQVEASAGGRRRSGSTEDQVRRMEERKTKALNLLSRLQEDTLHQPNKGHSNFEDFDFLAKYCIFSQEKLAEYKRAFEAEDSDGDGYISCLQVLLALKSIIPPELLSDEEEIYVYRILEMVDFRVTDGLVDLRLFAVISSLAQKISTMDEFMRSLISDMDFRSLEVRLFKAKRLFLFLLEEQQGDTGAQQGVISAEQLLLELKAGGIHLEQEAAVRLELQRMPPLDLLDFLAYLPLFMLIHKSVISNPLDDSSDL